MYRTTYFWCAPCESNRYDRIISNEMKLLNRRNRGLTELLCIAGAVIYFQHKRIKSLRSRIAKLEKKCEKKAEADNA